MTIRLLLILSLTVLWGAATPGEAWAQARQPLLVPGKTTIYQRVIARPGATLSPGPSTSGSHPVPGFSVFYVYDRQGGDTGWVQVGAALDGHADGWMPAAKAIDWKHNMIAAFTSRAGRQPVLFLDSENSERRLMLDRDAGALSDRMRQAAAAGNPGPIIAMEPSNFVDIDRQFYLLPILDAQLVEREVGPPLRLLKVISAPADSPATTPPTSRDALQNYKAAVVFLIDTTASMQPYINATREALRAIIGQIGNTAVKQNFRFGVVAYRDSLEDNPGLEYPAKVYAKPDFSKPPEAVLPAMDDIHESRVSSTGFDEDPIGGIKTTLDSIDWNNLGGRFVILITDAGARVATHPHSVTRLGITEIKQLANEKQVVLMTIHLLTPEGERRHDHELARDQYQDLSRFNATAPLYFPVAHGDPAAFRQTVQQITEALLQQVATTTGVPLASLHSPDSPPPPPNPQLNEQIRVVSEAMRLSYLGRVQDTRAPDVTTSWTTDRDLKDTNTFSLDVRVLLNRNQLSDLVKASQAIMQAGLAGRTQPETFFAQLRTAFAAAGTDPQRIAQAAKVSDLLGEYLNDLPYKSEIMNIDQDSWSQMGPIGQRVVLNNVESRLRLYQEYQAQGAQWLDLAHSGRAGDAVFPVPLEALP